MTASLLPAMHEPASAVVLYIDAAVGAAILWAKLGKQNRRVYGLSEMVDLLFPESWKHVRMLVELIIFLSLGTFVTVQVFGPSTGGQAFAAGMGWTAGLASR
jgi:hypothetical protein